MAYIVERFARLAVACEPEEPDNEWQDNGFKGASDRKRFIALQNGATIQIWRGGGGDGEPEELTFHRGAVVLVGDGSLAYVESQLISPEQAEALQKAEDEVKRILKENHPRSKMIRKKA